MAAPVPTRSLETRAPTANRRRRALLLQMLIFFAAVAVLPLFVHNNYYLHIGVFIGIHVLIVIGLNLLIGYAGQVSLGHAAFYGIGAYTSGILTTTYHWPAWPAMAVALALTCAVAWVVGKPTLRLKGHYLAMATLGVGIIVVVLLRQMVWLTGGPSGLTNIPCISVAGYPLATDRQYYYFVWCFVALLTLLLANIVDSRAGRALRALHDSELAAGMLGVDTGAMKLRAFVISAGYASIAGSLYAHSSMHFLSPVPFDFHTSVALLVMVVLGGAGTIWGPFFGATTITLIQEALRRWADYDIIVYGLLLMILMIMLPGGVAEGLQRLTQWGRRQWRQRGGGAL